MSDLPENESASHVEEIKKIIEDIKNDSNLYEDTDKLVNLVNLYHLDQRDDCKPLLKSFCGLLKEKGYPDTSEILLEKWHL
jgi:hypothetical protein